MAFPRLYFDICLESEVMFFSPLRKHSILNQILCPHSRDGREDSVGQICGLLRSKRTAPRGAVEKLTPVSGLRSSGASQRERIPPSNILYLFRLTPLSYGRCSAHSRRRSSFRNVSMEKERERKKD